MSDGAESQGARIGGETRPAIQRCAFRFGFDGTPRGIHRLLSWAPVRSLRAAPVCGTGRKGTRHDLSTDEGGISRSEGARHKVGNYCAQQAHGAANRGQWFPGEPGSSHRTRRGVATADRICAEGRCVAAQGGGDIERARYRFAWWRALARALAPEGRASAWPAQGRLKRQFYTHLGGCCTSILKGIPLRVFGFIESNPTMRARLLASLLFVDCTGSRVAEHLTAPGTLDAVDAYVASPKDERAHRKACDLKPHSGQLQGETDHSVERNTGDQNHADDYRGTSTYHLANAGHASRSYLRRRRGAGAENSTSISTRIARVRLAPL